MIGNYGTVRFLLVNKDLKEPRITVTISSSMDRGIEKYVQTQKERKPVEWVWKIATFPPNVQYISLNGETFSESLLSVITNE